ncbi:mucin-5B-like isoform X2 [Eriocheir sinensis]|uniref:mucin-5B-like isoform X2 n=1 Tax=Eriocheir sinensis TaxID=95602 RepID=UPI0021CAC1D7|nr:mucin-5B-like isoform X2 [Eriocheir sinensis]
MALKVPSSASWGVVVLLFCALAAEARPDDCCYGRKNVAHGETVLTIPSCCVSFSCSDGDIRPSHLGGVGASGCCEFGGQLYPNGSSLSAHCSSLRCVNGNWTWTGRFQDCCGRCTLHNSGHVMTFDKTHYHWAGPCNYTVAQTGSSQHPETGVFTSFAPCHGSYCLQKTTFRNDPYTVVSLSHDHTDGTTSLLVNGNLYAVPSSGVHTVTVGGTTYPLLAWRTPYCIALVGSSGIMLLHCRYRLDVWAYPTHASQLHGLCGHFNFNPLDDMTARDGTVYPVTTFPLAFPESWRTAEQSSVQCKQCRDCGRPTRDNMCKARPAESKAYYTRCAKLLHPVLAVDTQLKHHVDACEFELCLLHQAGASQQQQQRQLDDQLRIAQISKGIHTRTMGEFVPDPLFAPLEGSCTPGSSWQQDCNRCGCTDSAPGVPRCTRIACLDDFVPALGEEYCTNGSRWRGGECSVCECIRNGQVCSPNECSGVSPPVTQSLPVTQTTSPFTFPPFSVCSLPKDEGSCHGFALKWHYDVVAGRCTQFYYTGCGGNQNNFDSERECQLMCGNFPFTTVSPSKPSGCYLDPEEGPCEALLPRYYYSHATDRCEKFYYGGCEGNSNRFTTLEECLQTCGVASNATTLVPSACHLQWDAGTCQGSRLKYYYDARADQCFGAYYSGCGGNGNRFNSVLECMQTCSGAGTTTSTPCDNDLKSCPLDCPLDYVLDPVTNCFKCVCSGTSSTLPTAPTCPPHYMVCPTYCRSTYVTDHATGCRKCVCDSPLAN